MRGRPAQEIGERLKSKISIDSNGCWLWDGALLNTGYGQIFFNGKNRTTHRVSYEVFVGDIPTGLVLDHLCGVRRCINPDHLEAVTNRENVLRGNSPMAKNARKTHCDSGHLLSAHSYIYKGKRLCRECRKMRAREFRAREKEKLNG